jgi:Ca2+-binding EF-hand superfamily protein
MSPLKENVPSQPKPIQQQNFRRHNNNNTHQSSSLATRTTNQPTTTTTSSYSLPSTFSQSEIQELTNSFNLFDVHGTGSVVVSELRNVLEMLQDEQQEQQQKWKGQGHEQQINATRIKIILEKLAYMGEDEEATLTLDDYIQLMASTTVAGSVPSEGEEEYDAIPAIFELFDLDGKGYISIHDLQRVSVELGEQMSTEELEEMIRRAKNNIEKGQRQEVDDASSLGRVTLEDFQRVLRTNFSVPLRRDHPTTQD